MTVLQVNYGEMHPCQLLIMGIMEDRSKGPCGLDSLGLVEHPLCAKHETLRGKRR